MSWRRKPRKRVLTPRLPKPEPAMQVTMNAEEMRAGPNEPPDTAVAQSKVDLRASDEPPMMIERMKKHEQGHEGASPTLSYEEANWARLSPVYRAAHNRLRQARGVSPLPPPAVDLYVKPQQSVIRPLDIEAELRSAVRSQATGLMGGGFEGFERR